LVWLACRDENRMSAPCQCRKTCDDCFEQTDCVLLRAELNGV
jgi:hypothetical protein